jgi:hypothetical protein
VRRGSRFRRLSLKEAPRRSSPGPALLHSGAHADGKATAEVLAQLIIERTNALSQTDELLAFRELPNAHLPGNRRLEKAFASPLFQQLRVSYADVQHRSNDTSE